MHEGLGEKWVEDIMHFLSFFPWTLISLGGEIEFDVSFFQPSTGGKMARHMKKNKNKGGDWRHVCMYLGLVDNKGGSITRIDMDKQTIAYCYVIIG